MNIDFMQNYINEIELKFGRMSSSLNLGETLCQTYAYEAGFNILGTLIGTIYVNRQLVTEDLFTIHEINFILAHEYTHIFKNHYVASTFGSALEIFAKEPRNEIYSLIEFLKAVARPAELLLKIQEYEADYGAEEITRDQNSAENCLSKLVGGDLKPTIPPMGVVSYVHTGHDYE
jgi:Peptidase family M48